MILATEVYNPKGWVSVGVANDEQSGVVRDFHPGGGEDIYVTQVLPDEGKAAVLLTLCGVVLDGEIDALGYEVIASLGVGEMHEMTVRPDMNLVPRQIRFRCLETPSTS